MTLTESRIDGQDPVSQKAAWLLIAVALNAAELAIPRLPFLPWLKPGFANIITILWIIKFGFKDAALYTMLRIWISGFYFGFSLFTLSLSLAGGLLSTAVMSALWVSLGKRGWMGTVGIAAAGALCHNAGQLGVVYFTMAQNISLFAQAPFMLGAAIVFGGTVGLLTPVVAKIVGFYDNYKNIENINTTKMDVPREINTSKIDVLVVSLTFTVSILLMFVDDMMILVCGAGVFSLAALLTRTLPKFFLIIFYPLKFYILFMFVAVTHLFFSYGTRVGVIPFITHEGLTAFAIQSLRLWCWLQTVHIFNRFHFQEIFIDILHRFFPNKKETLAAGMIALKHFPDILRITKSGKKFPVTALLFKPQIVLTEYVREINRRIFAG